LKRINENKLKKRQIFSRKRQSNIMIKSSISLKKRRNKALKVKTTTKIQKTKVAHQILKLIKPPYRTIKENPLILLQISNLLITIQGPSSLMFLSVYRLRSK
jgi:hypothetical protein